MTYEKTNWVDGITPLDAAHMNKIEEGIANASQEADQSSTNISQLQTQVEGLVNDTTEIKADIAELTTSGESKLPKQDVDVLQDITINVQGDQAFLTKTTVNLNNDTLTPAQGSSTQIIPDATSSQSGLMTSSDVIAIQNMQEQIQQLQTKATRLLYTEKTDPTADDINTFVVSQGYTSPFVGIAVVVSGTNHIWYYYEGDVGWRDDGVDVVSNFTNSVAGIIKGSTSDGQVYAETDGTGSVNGWDALKNNVTNLSNQFTNYTPTSNLSAVALSGSYNDLLNRPVLAIVATSGDYNDLINRPTIPTININGVAQSTINFDSDPQTQIDEINNSIGNISTILATVVTVSEV